MQAFMQETCPYNPLEAPPEGGGCGKATPEEKERKKRWGARRSHLREARELLVAQGKLGDRTPMVFPTRKIANPGACWQGKVKKRQQEEQKPHEAGGVSKKNRRGHQKAPRGGEEEEVQAEREDPEVEPGERGPKGPEQAG